MKMPTYDPLIWIWNVVSCFAFPIYRCSQIMGRSEQDELTAAQIFYPCMQCADIFFLKVKFTLSLYIDACIDYLNLYIHSYIVYFA